MSESETFQHRVSQAIRDHAMSLPETEEGTSCVNRAFKAGGKNFAFLGEKPDHCSLRLKLDASTGEIRTRAETEGRDWNVGSHGWTMLKFGPDDPPSTDDLQRWVTESFLLLAPKKVAKLLDG